MHNKERKGSFILLSEGYWRCRKQDTAQHIQRLGLLSQELVVHRLCLASRQISMIVRPLRPSMISLSIYYKVLFIHCYSKQPAQKVTTLAQEAPDVIFT